MRAAISNNDSSPTQKELLLKEALESLHQKKPSYLELGSEGREIFAKEILSKYFPSIK